MSRCLRPHCRAGVVPEQSVNLQKSSTGSVSQLARVLSGRSQTILKILQRTNEVWPERTNEAFRDTGKGNAAAAVVPSQLYLAHSWGGACARGAVGGGRQIASRTICTRIDLGRRGREDFFAAWRPQWCVPCLVLDGRPGVQRDVLLPGWPTVGCNFRGNGWERDMLFIGLCGRVRGDGS